MSIYLRASTHHLLNRLIKCSFRSQRKSVSYLLTKLSNRKLIKVNGTASYDYLQGMITNDTRHLKNTLETSVNLNAIFAFVLNHLGRIICDVFVYKGNDIENNELFVEVDTELYDGVFNYLRIYKVKRKVLIEKVDFTAWALFPEHISSVNEFNQKYVDHELDSETMIVKDPRLKEMGFRILSKYSYENEDKISGLLKSKGFQVKHSSLNDYEKHRYQLGVGEGAKDHPTEACFPLEANADYLHGVSLHKGCYVGQELTARVYHTGVIRKRLMPIEIQCDEDKMKELNLSLKTSINSSDGKNIGKLRSNNGKYGLALLRVSDALKCDKMILEESNYEVETWRPNWWPREMSKEHNVLPNGIGSHMMKAKEEIEVKRSRLLYQSRKRGMLENDLILGTFAGKYLDKMTEEELELYDHLINSPSNDWDIYKWATGAVPIPKEYDNQIMKKLIEHVKNTDKETRFRQPDL